jgi:hypothetical protein
MTFDEFCDKKEIRGNYREALFHHIMAKYPSSILVESEELFEKEWAIVLKQIYEKVMAG